jgi:signal transduction histidine kinase
MSPKGTRKRSAAAGTRSRRRRLPAGGPIDAVAGTTPTNEELTILNAQLQDKVHELNAVNDDLANLLVSTEIATVFVDTDFRIKRFTTAASHLLNLLPADVGRPMNHLATNLADVDLSRDARTVLSTLTRIEKEVATQNGSQYLLRVFPYRTGEQKVQGVVLTLVDVTSLKTTERELRATREQLSGELRRMGRLHEVVTILAESDDMSAILDAILEAAVEVTGADMGMVQLFHEPAGVLTIVAHRGCERPFLDAFHEVRAQTDCACAQALATRQRVVTEDVRTSPLFAGSPSLAVLLASGVQAIQSTPLLARSGRFVGLLTTHSRAPHVFGESELRWLDLLTRHAADVIIRRQTDEWLARAHAELEQRVADRTKWLTLMHDVTRAINDASTWDEGLHEVLQGVCETADWQIGFVYLPDRDDPHVIAPAITCVRDERFRPFHETSEHRRYPIGQPLPGRIYEEGAPAWVNGAEELMAILPLRGEVASQVGLQAAAAFPIRFGRDIIAVLELFSDELHPPDEVLMQLMNDVSGQIGKVLERERSTARMADLVWREQQGLLHTLHDSLGQTLTGLGMLSAGLVQQFAGMNQDAADRAGQLAEQAQVALDQVRQLSRGLFPVDVDAHSLLPALRDLASTTEEMFHRIRVHVLGEMPGSIQDAWVATQLYRIAQEAVTNAVKHARATAIAIELTEHNGAVTLRVLDDGIGIPGAMTTNDGMGLQIMRYRATSIAAQFRVDAAAGGGTEVVCTLRTSRTVRAPEAPS